MQDRHLRSFFKPNAVEVQVLAEGGRNPEHMWKD